MKNWIIICFVLCGLQGLKSQETFPVNGVNDPRQALHAFTNATVYVSADVRMEKATLLVQDGKVVSVATSGKVPNHAIEHGCSGKTIYPSFIDIYSGLNVEKKTNKKGTTSVSSLAANWNPAIHPEYNYEPIVPINKKGSKIG